MVKRYDKLEKLDAGTITDAGFLKAPALLTRIGVFEYPTTNGTVIRELRLPEEVFSKEALDSFELVPVTDNHPPTGVSLDNARAVSAGSVANIRQDGEYVAGQILITDAGLIAKVSQGKQQLSCGYNCDLEPAAEGAEWKDSEGVSHKYDFIQRNIRGNHVAVVAVGRAGPRARIQLDSHDSVLEFEEQEIVKMVKITLDSVEFDVSEEVASAVASLKAQLDKESARADSAELESKQAKEALAVATSPETIQAAVAARVAVEKLASDYGIKADGLDAAGVKKEIVAKLNPEVKLDGKSEDYIQAAFDLLTAQKPVNPLTAAAEQAVASAPKSDGRSLAEIYSAKLLGKLK